MSNENENKRIDLTQYKGHTKGDNEVGWRINNNFVSNDKCPNDRYIAYVRYEGKELEEFEFSDADANLIADAPLFVAELKRCYEEIDRVRSIAEDLHAYIVSDADISLSIAEKQMDWVEASE